MVINIIICIVAVILLLRGIFLVTYMWLLWTFYSKIMTTYSMKVYGEVVDIEMQAKSDGMNITDVCIPKIKYKKKYIANFFLLLQRMKRKGMFMLIFIPNSII